MMHPGEDSLCAQPPAHFHLSCLLVQVPIVEPEILLDGEHDIDRTLEVSQVIVMMCKVMCSTVLL